jgi:hypothetical protein
MFMAKTTGQTKPAGKIPPHEDSSFYDNPMGLSNFNPRFHKPRDKR